MIFKQEAKQRVFLTLTLLILAVRQSQSFEGTCNKINLSSDLGRGTSDIVKNGNIDERWVSGSVNPIFSQQSLQVDFFYLTVKDYDRLSNNNLELMWDDHFFADSSAEISNVKQLSDDTYQYSIAVYYQCQKQGGTLIQYQLDIRLPQCGLASVFWNQPCGNPIAARQGLYIDIPFQKFNQTIVRDGLIVNASYFDKDVDNFVFQVPPKYKTTEFYIYLADPNDSSEEYENKEVLQKLPDDEQIDQIYVDGDNLVIEPVLQGNIVRGGQITKKPQKVVLEYNCKKAQTALVELTINLHYFRDVNLFFVKECPGSSLLQTLREKEQEMGLSKFLLVFGIVICLMLTVFNQFIRGLEGVQAVPCLASIFRACLLIDSIQYSPLGQKMTQALGDSPTSSNRPYVPASTGSSSSGSHNSRDLQIQTVPDAPQNASQQQNYGSL